MTNDGSFQLAVETRTYKNGIVTRDMGIVNERTLYGLQKLSEALYVSATACADRHTQLEIMRRKRKKQ